MSLLLNLAFSSSNFTHVRYRYYEKNITICELWYRRQGKWESNRSSTLGVWPNILYIKTRGMQYVLFDCRHEMNIENTTRNALWQYNSLWCSTFAIKKKEKFDLNCKSLEHTLLTNKYFYYLLIFHNNIGIVIVEKERALPLLGN